MQFHRSTEAARRRVQVFAGIILYMYKNYNSILHMYVHVYIRIRASDPVSRTLVIGFKDSYIDQAKSSEFLKIGDFFHCTGLSNSTSESALLEISNVIKKQREGYNSDESL